jgi:epoxyqueuosine reductase QueG
VEVEQVDRLTELVRKAALGAGADLVGVAPVSRFDNAPPQYHPRTIFPQTRSVVAVAVRHARGTLKTAEEGTYFQAYVCDSYWYLNEVVAPQVLRAAVLALEDKGYTGVPVHNPFRSHVGRQLREDQAWGPDGMVSLRLVGVAAGLGELGHSKVLLTPQFGPRQRVFAVFTDAELEPTPLFTGSICDGCVACARECEAGAIGEERSVRLKIEGQEYAHAPFDQDACLKVHAGTEPPYSPFWKGDEPEGKEPAYHSFLKHRFRHFSVCVGRGCLRTCLDHLEKAGRIEARFATPMIERERYRFGERGSGRKV